MLSFMATLLVRQVDDQLVVELKRRAAANRQSVQQFLRELLRKSLSSSPATPPRPLMVVETGNSRPFLREDIYGEDDRG